MEAYVGYVLNIIVILAGLFAIVAVGISLFAAMIKLIDILVKWLIDNDIKKEMEMRDWEVIDTSQAEDKNLWMINKLEVKK